MTSKALILYYTAHQPSPPPPAYKKFTSPEDPGACHVNVWLEKSIDVGGLL